MFTGQTEFSVHYSRKLKKFIQIQTFGFGKASIGYRLADELFGPWSDPVFVYTPTIKEGEFVYTANAHPEFKSDGLLITYNINQEDLDRLISNEDIYFPRIIEVGWVRYLIGDSLDVETSEFGAADLLLLSMVNPRDYSDWNEDDWKKKYPNNNVLIVVSEKDSEQRQQFLLNFYKFINEGNTSYKKAYDKTLALLREQFGQVDLKYLLILK